MAESQKQLHIRTLSGESTTIQISSNNSIQHLKVELGKTFPPANDPTKFHLFFKGAKMSLRRNISSYSIGKEEFIVLAHVKKKDQNYTSSCCTKAPETSTSDAADSIWTDLMQDLSSLAERNQNFQELNDNGICPSTSLNPKKPQRDDNQKRIVGEVLESSKNSSAIGEEGYEKIAQVSDSVNCLCDTNNEKCLLATMLGSKNAKSCQCPIWLKKLLKSFSFLNIYSGFLQMRSLDVTWDCLNRATMNLGTFGLKVGVEDLKHLSVICPKIVMIGNPENGSMKSGDAIVIGDSSRDNNPDSENNNIRPVRKQVSTSTVVNIIKKREIAFKANLWWAIRISIVCSGKQKSGNGLKVLLSLEDLLVLMKNTDSATRWGEAKRARTDSSVPSSSRSGKTRCHDMKPLSPAKRARTDSSVPSSSRSGKTRCHDMKPLSPAKRARTDSSVPSSSRSGKTRCHDMKPLSPAEMVQHLREGIGSRGQIVHVEEIGARIAAHRDFPNGLAETTKAALKKIGVSRLYCHQAEAIQASLAGRDVVVATMTSSGKSLCYNVPVLEAISQSLMSCALYLFPTKALAQDQIRALSVMTEGMDISFTMGVYDGDTPREDRMWLRDNARLLITNPDMLHVSILPFHTQFHRILSNLRYVVIDEAHTYKGAFGCHTSLILRRLRRLCRHVYGSNPSFVFCTATSANPREHAMELAGLPQLELIQNDGSPSGPKLFVLWNPPLYKKIVRKSSSGIDKRETEVIWKHSSPVLEVSSLFAEMVQHGLRCIAFCKTRKLCELVLFHTREILQEAAPSLVNSICSYRAGYIAQDRRRLESEFFGGKLRGVAATNALELGIDVGHIDATLHLGFPGSVSSLWQQAGRSGRREKASLAVYVAFEGPLDQYFMKFPQKLFRRPIECCQVDAKNSKVLEQHLLCAAVEHPLSLFHDEKYFGPGLDGSITALANKGYLSSDQSRDLPSRIWSYIGHEKRPSYEISIRAIETEKYKVVDKKTNEVIEEIEESKAFFQVYEGAVYMQQGKTYLVKDLDTFEKIAICEEAGVDYYTRTRDYTDVNVLGGDLPYPVNQSLVTAQARSCNVTTTWFGFFCIKRASNEICGEGHLSLPQYSYESEAVWIRVPESIRKAVESQNLSFPEGLHAAAHAVVNVVPLFIQCNSSDLASECVNPHQILTSADGTIYRKKVPDRILLYDHHPGGNGISVQVQPRFREVLVAGLQLLTTCDCSGETGCPSCVQTFCCSEYNSCLHKNAAIIILKGVLESVLSH